MQEENLANLVPPLILRLLGTSFTFQLTLASVVKPLVNCEEIWWVVGANLGTHVANNFLVIFLLKHLILSLEISLEAGRKLVVGANLGTPLILSLY